MDLETLKTFCVVAQQRSFKKAAEILNVTQPGITKRIQNLEEELGVLLLDRSPQLVSLTPQGKEFLPYAERAVAIIAEGSDRISAAAKNENLVIGATPTTCFNFLPHVLKEFQARYSLRVTVHTVPSQQVCDMLADQTIDIGLTTSYFSNPRIHFEEIFKEKIVCVAHPELVRQHFRKNRIIKQPIPVISTLLNTFPWNQINSYIKDNPLFNVILEAHFSHLVKKMARMGIGFAFQPLPHVQEDIFNGNLKVVTFPDFQLSDRSVYLITSKNKNLTMLQMEFVRIMKNMAAAISSRTQEMLQPES